MTAGRPTADYVFDNAHAETERRFGALEEIYDPISIRSLEPVIREGSHCLEVGGGSGSIARWMSERAGPGGRVVATDIDVRFLSTIAAPNLEARQHDVTSDPLEEGAFDVAHTRLVLLHLPERRRVLERLIAALRSGGWLVLQEFEANSLLADPAEFEGEQRLKTFVAMQDLMRARGLDTQFGRRLYPLLISAGLVDVGAEGHIMFHRGGSSGAALFRANFHQAHDALIESGRLTEEEFAVDLAHLDDPAVVWPSQIMWTVRGRKA